MTTEKCTCFDDLLKELEVPIRKSLPEGVIDVAISWKDYAFFMSGDYSPVNPHVKYEYRFPKKGGGHRANLTKKEVTMTASHCCYCGRKLNKADKGGE